MKSHWVYVVVALELLNCQLRAQDAPANAGDIETRMKEVIGEDVSGLKDEVLAGLEKD